MRKVTIVVAETGALVANASVAEQPTPRAIGLLGRSTLARGDGLVLTPCRSIHTWFMRFTIDVAFVDDAGRVQRVFERLPPWRLVWGGRQSSSAIEVPAGTLSERRITAGTVLRFSPAL